MNNHQLVSPSLPPHSLTEEGLRRIFSNYDLDRNGLIRSIELGFLIRDMGFFCDDNDLACIMEKTLDVDHSGCISFEDLFQAYERGEVVCEVPEEDVSNWNECWDYNDRNYFYNQTTGKSSWFKPQFRQSISSGATSAEVLQSNKCS